MNKERKTKEKREKNREKREKERKKRENRKNNFLLSKYMFYLMSAKYRFKVTSNGSSFLLPRKTTKFL